MQEWTSDFHPFNSLKHFSQIYRWKDVGKTPAPAPASVSLDPSNICQLNCTWCNSAYNNNLNPKMISKEALLEIAELLNNFTDHSYFNKVNAVCIAGGGEPLTNPAIQDFIDKISEYGIKPGVITNGIFLDKFDLSKCEWVGVSVDAGTKETYEKLKGGDYFDKVIKNMRNLVKVKGLISKPGKAHGVSYKFVMYPHNIKEIYIAAKLAKDIGCNSFHLRPYGVPFKGGGIPFTKKDILNFRKQLTKARKLEGDNFKVYGITHKFDGKFKVNNDFKKCYAVAFSSTFEPPTNKQNKGFDVALCCDRRGDPSLTLKDMNAKKFRKFWGSKKHLSLIDTINPKLCPRCTRGPHNRIYEKAIKEDNVGYEFG